MYEDQTTEELLKRMLANVSDSIDKREGSIIYDALAPTAIEMELLYAMADYFLTNTFGDTAERTYLVERAKERGLSPTEATYATVKGSFTPTTLEIATGTRFSCDDYNYAIKEKVSDGVYLLTCETAGTAGNLTSGTLLPIDYISGLSTAEITEVTIPGEDEEDTEAFRARYLASFDSQAYGGNIADYKEKVNAIDGVGGCKIYPVWNGGGTVKVVFMTSEYKVPTADFINEVQTTLDPVTNSGSGVGIAPIGHRVTVEGVGTSNVAISMSITSDADASAYTSRINDIIDEYFADLNKKWASTKKDTTSLVSNTGITIRLAQLESRILDIDGIDDIENLTFNGEFKNLTLGVNDLAVRGDVNVTNS